MRRVRYGIKQCDLIVCDRRRVLVIPVLFNGTYWNGLAKRLDTFHLEHVFPAMVQEVSGQKRSTNVLEERKMVQNVVSAVLETYSCGKCGHRIVENVTRDGDAGIQCECDCKCQQWLHWKCVNYTPDLDNFEVEPAWLCVRCMRNWDIVLWVLRHSPWSQ